MDTNQPDLPLFLTNRHRLHPSVTEVIHNLAQSCKVDIISTVPCTQLRLSGNRATTMGYRSHSGSVQAYTYRNDSSVVGGLRMSRQHLTFSHGLLTCYFRAYLWI
jgi:hypothetical protein